MSSRAEETYVMSRFLRVRSIAVRTARFVGDLMASLVELGRYAYLSVRESSVMGGICFI